jgi:hypothetical protein
MNILLKIVVFATFLTVLPIASFSNPVSSPNPDSQKYFVTLRDFTKEEVKGIGFTLSKGLTIHISAVGGGSKNIWNELWGNKSQASGMYASGWIINADTRELVWEMSQSNTDGKEERRKCEKDLQLKKGSYEVYFDAYGFSKGSTFNFSSINIDRRENQPSGNKFVQKFLGWFDDDYKSMYSEFMDYAKDVWEISLSVPEEEKNSVQLFDAPLKKNSVVFAATGVGDNTFIRKKITVAKDISVNIYALGEGRSRDALFDYGWITNIDTRERVWEMKYRNVDYAGGAEKNIMFNGTVELAKGSYELDYVTDGSHSREDWNAKPPYDPFNYGVTISVLNENDKSAFSIADYRLEKKNVIVKLVRVGDDAFEEAGFSLKAESKLHIYAIGEEDNDGTSLADYGWIINAKTRNKVWEMDRENSTHAGGASKNRMVDEVISLPKGDYIVYYQTDDSHAYGEWNDDPPYDQDSYGITVMGAGDNFSMNSVAKYDDAEETDNILSQIIRVRDDEHLRKHFTLDKPTHVRIYAIGEGDGDEMADYGWIENAKGGDIVWEMTYRSTKPAGGARKNRMYDRSVLLDKGEYILHYQTDDSHAFGDWNDDPPEDRGHYGITIYKDQH